MGPPSTKAGHCRHGRSSTRRRLCLMSSGFPPTVIGYLFTDPLHAGADLNNKILWYVAGSREGQALVGIAHPLDAPQPTVSFTIPANSGPGEIYPSAPTAPSAGCWHFTVIWRSGAERSEVDLLFK